MVDSAKIAGTARPVKGRWLKYTLIILVVEKIIQHTLVTLAFFFNWMDIRSTVAISPDMLMVSGAVVAALFALSLWGLAAGKGWAPGLVSGLALFDIVGEFIAQGRLDIVINVSFIVAVALLALSLVYRRRVTRGLKRGIDEDLFSSLASYLADG